MKKVLTLGFLLLISSLAFALPLTVDIEGMSYECKPLGFIHYDLHGNPIPATFKEPSKVNWLMVKE